MKQTLMCALSVVLLATASTDALAKGGKRDPTFTLNHPRTDFEKRYPGDQWVGDGMARVRGPDKGPYIERCTWVARSTFLGLPWGLQQRCWRYTLENTQ